VGRAGARWTLREPKDHNPLKRQAGCCPTSTLLGWYQVSAVQACVSAQRHGPPSRMWSIRVAGRIASGNSEVPASKTKGSEEMHQNRFWLTAILVGSVTGVVLGQEKQRKPEPAGPPQPPQGVQALRDLEYVPGGHERQKLDLYLPGQPASALPLVVWIHPGGGTSGSKEQTRALYLTTQGYAVASINHRLIQHAAFPAQIHDCKAAIRWLRAHCREYRLDPDRIGVWGASSGGTLAALLGTSGGIKELEGREGANLDQSSRVQAVCDWFGPSDVRALAALSAELKNDIERALGGPIDENNQKVLQGSPVTQVSKDDPPFLIMHGDEDMRVPVSQSQLLADALKRAGVDVTLKIVPGAGHGGPAFQTAEMRELIQEFFNKHLKKAIQK
jgi:acetyl esterase/lipase